jgi:hypothetical protein
MVCFFFLKVLKGDFFSKYSTLKNQNTWGNAIFLMKLQGIFLFCSILNSGIHGGALPDGCTDLPKV